MDRNNTGTIDWWEFVNHEAVKVLGRRDKVIIEFFSCVISVKAHNMLQYC